MNTSDKLLTVIVPSYNMEEYLPKCLGSLIVPDETLLQRLDVIVVNDGSQDRTSEIAHGYETRFPGVFRIIDKVNGHYGSCINAALPEAKGEYIRTLDADDWVLTDGFTQLLKQLSKEATKGAEGADLVFTDYDWISATGSIVLHLSTGFPVGDGHTLLDFPRLESYVQSHGLTYRTDVVRRIGYRQLEGVSFTDVQWQLEPISAVKRVMYLPVTVVQYFVERPGQSVEGPTFLKNYWHFAEVAKTLGRNYPRLLPNCTEEARDYYRRNVLRFISDIYQAGIYGKHGRTVNIDLVAFDSFIRSIPEVLDATERYRMPTNHFPIRLIHAWRHHPGRGTPVLVAWRIFLSLKAIRRKVHRALSFFWSR